MANASTSKNANLSARFRKLFADRDFIFHDGRDLKRFSVAGRTQALLAGVAVITVCFSAYGVAQATAGALSGVAALDMSPEAQMARMRSQVEKMQADVDAAKEAAKAHAARVEARQALIDQVTTGKGDRSKLAQPLPASDSRTSAVAEEVIQPLRQVEQRQLVFAIKARAVGEARFAAAANHIRALGLDPQRFSRLPAMGGPYEPLDSADAANAETANADAQFRSLFLTWQKLDAIQQASISIPSIQPVANLTFTSNFGVRADPFRGTAAMHAGVDIPGPLGTPVYATADGIVERAGRAGGYGNLVELGHGKGIETRYGHLSKILVEPNARVKRGQLIGLMGSTGRSTGSHLHYEVRVDGHAVNPIPFLQTGGAYVVSTPSTQSFDAVGGPANAD